MKKGAKDTFWTCLFNLPIARRVYLATLAVTVAGENICVLFETVKQTMIIHHHAPGDVFQDENEPLLWLNKGRQQMYVPPNRTVPPPPTLHDKSTWPRCPLFARHLGDLL